MPQAQAKLAAAHAAIDYIEHKIGDAPWHIGVGTGSTVNAFIELLAQTNAKQHGRLELVVASSQASHQLLESHGIGVTDTNQAVELDFYLDGADRVTKNGSMIKGGGGAMFGEKLVAQLSHTFVCIAETNKLVEVLGGFPVAVEVAHSARSYVARKLVGLGGQPELREGFVTDQGNLILDVHNLEITDPAGLEDAINTITGVLDNGLFGHKRANVILLGESDGDGVIRLPS